MAREAPNPFGTSLIDLLVSGLAMVGMLWVMNATNNGLLGTGEEETTSGMVLVEQFGAARHMREVTVTLPGSWTCTFDLVWSEGMAKMLTPPWTGSLPAAVNRGCVNEPGFTSGGWRNATDGRIAFQAPGAPAGVETTVLLRLEAPGSSFFTSLTVTVEKLAGQNLDVRVGIQPCCDPNEPHYVRVQTFSGAGPRSLLTYWQAAERLRDVFAVPFRNADGTYDEPKAERVQNWILDLGGDLRTGQADPVRTLFDVPAGTDCREIQAAPLPTLHLTFEAEGEIQVRLPPPTGASAEFGAMVANFDNRLSAYLDWLDEVRP